MIWHFPFSVLQSSTFAIILLGLLYLSFVSVVHTNDERLANGRIRILCAPTSSWLSRLRMSFKYVVSGYRMIFEFLKKENGQIVQVPLMDPELFILPPQYIDELKSQPESVASSSLAVDKYFLGSYTSLNAYRMMGKVTWNVIHSHLTQKLGTLVRPLSERCKLAFEKEFPDCKDWTSVPVHHTLLQIVGRTTGAILVGDQLVENKAWLNTSIDFASCVFLSSAYLKVLPPVLQLFGALLSPHIWRIWYHHYNARRILIPEIKRRRQAREDGQDQVDRPRDMLDALIEMSEGPDAEPESIVNRQLGLSFAAIHTTTNHLTNVIYDLAARWDQYAPELIKEIETALEADNGTMLKSTVTKLSKLDSFMKESQRLNPPSALSFNRKLLADYQLSDGQSLVRSSYIAVASGPDAQSADHFLHPAEFDGFRFDRLRRGDGWKGLKATHFTSTGPGSLVFGHGRFACPGRFFAGLESKIILCHIVQSYELRLPVGASRPKNLNWADANFPDPNKSILFHRK
ncbi:cytochrome P450 [Viridothelium virens]|uniref:Cytochrome P450 n=1 Tax=Viridothelium virens TaxID=1048519 RepID=A0A6A6H675_VIRVR|nr:cytochrome P450 [Viridothelium virens]